MKPTKATVLAESSILYFIFSLCSHHYGDIYRRESGRCRPLSYSFYHFSTFLSYDVIFEYQLSMSILAMSIHVVLSVKLGSTRTNERFYSSLVHDCNMSPQGGSISVHPLALRARSRLMKCKFSSMSSSSKTWKLSKL